MMTMAVTKNETSTVKAVTKSKTSTVKSAQPEQTVTVITVNGVDVQIDTRDLDSVDVLYQLRDVNNGDMFAALDVIDVLIGEEQRKKLVDTIRDPDTRRASAGDFEKLLTAIFEAIPKS